MTTPPSDSIRVFLNGVGMEVPAGTEAVDAVRRFDSGLAERWERGEVAATDGRALPVDPHATLVAGSILRVRKPARQGAE